VDPTSSVERVSVMTLAVRGTGGYDQAADRVSGAYRGAAVAGGVELVG